MAKTFTIKSHSYDGRYLQLDCVQTQDIATNSSTISWTLSSIGGNTNYYATGPTTVIIGGTTVYYQAAQGWTARVFPVAKGSTSGTTTIYHNDDGAKTISVSLSTAIYTGVVETASNNWTLDKNPRKATLTSVPTSFYDTDNPKITFSNLAGSSVSSLEVGIFSSDGNTAYAGYRSVPVTSSEYTFNLTAAERTNLRNALTQDTMTKCEFVIRTTINGTQYTDYKYSTLNLKDYEVIIEYTVEDGNEQTSDLTGNTSVLVKYFSNVVASIQCRTTYGVGVEWTSIKNGDNSQTNVNSYVFDAVENNKFSFYATDARGTSAEEHYTAPMVDYVKLTANIVSADLNTDGELTIKYQGNYFNDTFGAVRNNLLVYLYYREKGATYWENGNPGTLTFNGNTYSVTCVTTGLDYRKTYEVYVLTVDSLMDVASSIRVVSSYPVFDWSKDDFNFNVPVTINGNLTVTGTINGAAAAIGDYIIEQGTKTTGSGNSTANWVYRKWNSGIAECWCRKHVSTAVNTAWGNLYVSGALSYTNIDWGVSFTDIPVANITIAPNNSGAFLIAGGSTSLTATKTGGYEIARGSALASAGNFYINYYAIGKWK